MSTPREEVRGPQAVNGVARDAENSKAIVIYLREEATEDELRAVHEAALRAIAELAAAKVLN